MSDQLIIQHHKVKGQARAFMVSDTVVNLVSMWALTRDLCLTNYNPVKDEWQTHDGEIYSTENILNDGQH